MFSDPGSFQASFLTTKGHLRRTKDILRCIGLSPCLFHDDDGLVLPLIVDYIAHKLLARVAVPLNALIHHIRKLWIVWITISATVPHLQVLGLNVKFGNITVESCVSLTTINQSEHNADSYDIISPRNIEARNLTIQIIAH